MMYVIVFVSKRGWEPQLDEEVLCRHGRCSQGSLLALTEGPRLLIL
jgi:hypothetical protein